MKTYVVRYPTRTAVEVYSPENPPPVGAYLSDYIKKDGTTTTTAEIPFLKNALIGNDGTSLAKLTLKTDYNSPSAQSLAEAKTVYDVDYTYRSAPSGAYIDSHEIWESGIFQGDGILAGAYFRYAEFQIKKDGTKLFSVDLSGSSHANSFQATNGLYGDFLQTTNDATIGGSLLFTGTSLSIQKSTSPHVALTLDNSFQIATLQSDSDIMLDAPVITLSQFPTAGFVVTDGSGSISIDTSTYLDTTTAASTYAKLDGSNQPFTGNLAITNGKMLIGLGALTPTYDIDVYRSNTENVAPSLRLKTAYAGQNVQLILDSSATGFPYMYWQKAGTTQWRLGAANSGNFEFYSLGSAPNASALTLNRSSLDATFGGTITNAGETINATSPSLILQRGGSTKTTLNVSTLDNIKWSAVSGGANIGFDLAGRHYVGSGGTTSAALFVQNVSSTTDRVLVLKHITSGTGNFIELTNSSNTNLTYFSSAGALNIVNGNTVSSSFLNSLTTPDLFVAKQASVSNSAVGVASSTASDAPTWLGIRSRSTLASPGAVVNGDSIMRFIGAGYDGTNQVTSSAIITTVDGTVSTGVVPQKIGFFTSTTDGAGRTERLTIKANGLMGAGVTSPTAIWHLKAGTATANTAPLKFTSGTSLTTAEAGAVEFTTDDLFFTITTGAARKRFLFADPSGGLTSGQVPYVTTNGRLTSNSGMTYTGSDFNVSTGNIYTNSFYAGTDVRVGSAAHATLRRLMYADLDGTLKPTLLSYNVGSATLDGGAGTFTNMGSVSAANVAVSGVLTSNGRELAVYYNEDPTYTIESTNEVIACYLEPNSAAMTVSLPDIGDVDNGATFTVKDVQGHAATWNITVDGNGATIDGASTYVLSNDFESATFVLYSGNWMVI